MFVTISPWKSYIVGYNQKRLSGELPMSNKTNLRRNKKNISMNIHPIYSYGLAHKIISTLAILCDYISTAYDYTVFTQNTGTP